MGINNRRKTLKEVKEYFKSQGCKLLADKYINAHTKMKYRCVCGNISHIHLNNFQNGKRCGCGKKGVRLFSSDKIKKEVESLGYEFISEKYENNSHTITCICNCGEERTCKLQALRRGKGCCRKCIGKIFSLEYDYVKDFFKKNGCILLEEEYKNARKKLKYICACGNKSEICFDSFKNGNRCKECGIRKNSGSNNCRWIADREKKKENDLFRKRCRMMLRYALNRFGLFKNKKTEEILGYKVKDLIKHIKNHPNWSKVKDSIWHLDHIFPLQAFVDYDILDLRLANCLENLQPLNGIENISKNCKYNEQDFEVWLKSKNISF